LLSFAELPQKLRDGLEAEALDGLALVMNDEAFAVLRLVAAHDGGLKLAIEKAVCLRAEQIGLPKLLDAAHSERDALAPSTLRVMPRRDHSRRGDCET
jgi:hypothetical protein